MNDKASFDAAVQKLHWRNRSSRHDAWVLVGNKLGLVEETPSLRQVEREEAEGVASKYKMAYIETSAKTGAGVIEAFIAALPRKNELDRLDA